MSALQSGLMKYLKYCIPVLEIPLFGILGQPLALPWKGNSLFDSVNFSINLLILRLDFFFSPSAQLCILGKKKKKSCYALK